MRILVTGGAGFIGSHVCEALVKRGYNVSVFDDFSNGSEKNLANVHMLTQIKIIKGDICNKPDISTAMKDIDYVVHLAAIVSVQESVSNPEKCHSVNVGGTGNVLEAALANKVKRVIIASSAAVYGTVKPPLKETDVCTPISQYGQSKLLAEKKALEYCSKFGLEVICLRFFNVYGPRQNANSQYAGVISKFISALNKGKKQIIFDDGEQTRDFVYVEDVATAVLRSIETEWTNYQIFNIASGTPVSINKLLEILSLLLKKDKNVEHRQARYGDIKDSFADVTKASNILGFKAAYSLKEGLGKTINY